MTCSGCYCLVPRPLQKAIEPWPNSRSVPERLLVGRELPQRECMLSPFARKGPAPTSISHLVVWHGLELSVQRLHQQGLLQLPRVRRQPHPRRDHSVHDAGEPQRQVFLTSPVRRVQEFRGLIAVLSAGFEQGCNQAGHAVTPITLTMPNGSSGSPTAAGSNSTSGMPAATSTAPSSTPSSGSSGHNGAGMVGVSVASVAGAVGVALAAFV